MIAKTVKFMLRTLQYLLVSAMGVIIIAIMSCISSAGLMLMAVIMWFLFAIWFGEVLGSAFSGIASDFWNNQNVIFFLLAVLSFLYLSLIAIEYAYRKNLGLLRYHVSSWPRTIKDLINVIFWKFRNPNLLASNPQIHQRTLYRLLNLETVKELAVKNTLSRNASQLWLFGRILNGNFPDSFKIQVIDMLSQYLNQANAPDIAFAVFGSPIPVQHKRRILQVILQKYLYDGDLFLSFARLSGHRLHELHQIWTETRPADMSNILISNEDGTNTTPALNRRRIGFRVVQVYYEYSSTTWKWGGPVEEHSEGIVAYEVCGKYLFVLR